MNIVPKLDAVGKTDALSRPKDAEIRKIEADLKSTQAKTQGR